MYFGLQNVREKKKERNEERLEAVREEAIGWQSWETQELKWPVGSGSGHGSVKTQENQSIRQNCEVKEIRTYQRRPIDRQFGKASRTKASRMFGCNATSHEERSASST